MNNNKWYLEETNKTIGYHSAKADAWKNRFNPEIREFIQNSIDAGSSIIDIEITGFQVATSELPIQDLLTVLQYSSAQSSSADKKTNQAKIKALNKKNVYAIRFQERANTPGINPDLTPGSDAHNFLFSEGAGSKSDKPNQAGIAGNGRLSLPLSSRLHLAFTSSNSGNGSFFMGYSYVAALSKPNSSKNLDAQALFIKAPDQFHAIPTNTDQRLLHPKNSHGVTTTVIHDSEPKNWRQNYIQAAIRSFYPAICDGLLTLTVDTVKINQHTIEKLAGTSYEKNYPKGIPSHLVQAALTHQNKGALSRISSHPQHGKIRLGICRSDVRTIHRCRSHGMIITDNAPQGYPQGEYAIIIQILDKTTSNILGKSEDTTHDRWVKGHSKEVKEILNFIDETAIEFINEFLGATTRQAIPLLDVQDQWIKGERTSKITNPKFKTSENIRTTPLPKPTPNPPKPVVPNETRKYRVYATDTPCEYEIRVNQPISGLLRLRSDIGIKQEPVTFTLGRITGKFVRHDFQPGPYKLQTKTTHKYLTAEITVT